MPPVKIRSWKVWGVLVGLIAITLLVVAACVHRRNLDAWANLAQILQGIAVIATAAWWALVTNPARQRTAKESAEEQRRAKIYQAWQAISDAQGKPGSGGRRTALEELHREGESLVGVNLSGGAYIQEVALPGAWLAAANLRRANLFKANLQRAVLLGANLQSASLMGANLQGAVLLGADLQGAFLMGANLQGTTLGQANLKGARLDCADLSTALGLTHEQILSAQDWRGGKLPDEPSDVKALALSDSASQEDMDRLGRTWKPPKVGGA